MAVAGSLAVVTGNSLGLRVIDVTNPKIPVVTGSLSGIFRAASMSGQYACALEIIAGNPATVNLLIVDLSNPSNPRAPAP